MDHLSRQQRSANMSRVRSKDTDPEMIVRRLIHGLGIRYRLHVRQLPGSPDLVIRRLGKVIFIHGCFWHSHSCARGRAPSTNTDFWSEKLAANTRRDKSAIHSLRRAGWSVLTLWECQLKDLSATERRLIRFLRTSNRGAIQR